jgi:hypothetical protein
MRDIWQEHHRKIAELDRLHKRRMRVLTIASVILFVVLAFGLSIF